MRLITPMLCGPDYAENSLRVKLRWFGLWPRRYKIGQYDLSGFDEDLIVERYFAGWLWVQLSWFVVW